MTRLWNDPAAFADEMIGGFVAANGRYGPFLSWGKETRSLGGEEELFTVSLDAAVAILAQPKTFGRRQSAPAAPVKEFDPDPVSGQPIQLKEGRFGPYVTDGETNASLRRGDDPETVTIERAAELLADRRSKGPAPKRKRGSGKRSAA